MYLVAYSKRSLSYDADSLNAILEALNTLRKSSVYHIWGLPPTINMSLNFRAPVPAESHTRLFCDMGYGLGLPLSWCHRKAAGRRRGFPSWSLLGWEGAIEFWLFVNHQGCAGQR